MKTTLPLLLAGLSLAGCSSDPAEEIFPPAPEKFVSWVVDGQSVTTDHYLTGTGGSGQLPANTVLVAGRVYAQGNITVDLQLEVPLAVGTYIFGSTSAAWGTYTETYGTRTRYCAGTAPGITGAPGSGTIVVTEASEHHIAGTFTFTGVSPTGATKTIANGRFFVPE